VQCWQYIVKTDEFKESEDSSTEKANCYKAQYCVISLWNLCSNHCHRSVTWWFHRGFIVSIICYCYCLFCVAYCEQREWLL